MRLMEAFVSKWNIAKGFLNAPSNGKFYGSLGTSYLALAWAVYEIGAGEVPFEPLLVFCPAFGFLVHLQNMRWAEKDESKENVHDDDIRLDTYDTEIAKYFFLNWKNYLREVFEDGCVSLDMTWFTYKKIHEINRYFSQSHRSFSNKDIQNEFEHFVSHLKDYCIYVKFAADSPDCKRVSLKPQYYAIPEEIFGDTSNNDDEKCTIVFGKLSTVSRKIFEHGEALARKIRENAPELVLFVESNAEELKLAEIDEFYGGLNS
ncbi:hypothetical protein KHP62_00410 [Rhodobacteraceae bacterium NNCM2]|nr:hypothetical protein [Coraliihabitans acroporae]